MKKHSGLLLIAASTLMLGSCSMLSNIIEGALGGNEETGEESLPYSTTETQNKLDKIAEKDGLEIKAKWYSNDAGTVEETGETVFGSKNGIHWLLDSEDNEGTAYYLNKEGDHAYIYSYNDEQWEFNSSIAITSETKAEIQYYFSMSTWLCYGHDYDGIYKKSGTTTIAGRSCDVYSYSMNAIFEKFEYTVAIDKETGATMKYSIGASVYNESASAGFEVTQWKTSGVTAPNLPEPTVDDDDYSDDYDDDDDYTNGNTNSRYAEELKVTSKNDLHSVSNQTIVGKYSGGAEWLEEHDEVDLYDLGTMDIYWVYNGFNNDGSISQIKGYVCYYYFFSSPSAYEAAIEKMPSYEIRGTSPEHNYFTATARNCCGEAETYQEMKACLQTSGETSPSFSYVA